MVRISKQLIEKVLITLMMCVCFTLSSRAQCEANYIHTVDSVMGTVNCSNVSVVAFIDSPTVYTWYETPGNVLSNSVNPNISLAAGAHTLCLIVENEGCVDTVCKTVVMPERYCKAEYTYTVNNTTGFVTFTNHSIGAPGQYLWSFGDGGSFSTDSNTSFTFESGWYYVCLNSYNNDSSCNDVTCQFIRIQKPTPTPCIVDFTYEYDTLNSKLVHFSNQTFSDSSVNVIWLFPGDSTDTIFQPSFNFGVVGNYTVCMLVSGETCADSVCKLIEVIEILPVCEADFTYRLFADTVIGGSPRIAVFNNHSTGNNLTYEWRVNDSLVSEEDEPIYYFEANGTYKVCLTSRYQQFCSDSTCSLITVLSTSAETSEAKQSCDIAIFPNPAETFAVVEQVSCSEQIDLIRIYSVLGNVVYEQFAIDGATTISLANWTKGLYIVEIKTGNNLVRQKLNKL